MKKINTLLIISFFILNILSTHAKPEFILPSKNLKPLEVVKIQLDALKNNDVPKKNSGIEQTWIFAHPRNKVYTGPLSKFTNMLYNEDYRILLNHFSHEIILKSKTNISFIYDIKVISKEKKVFTYVWQVTKGNEKNCQECWFTISVNGPFVKGNSI
tara:strand:+ start:344 stop:814 length:471 start_codon:yes stop_codon:yes gene_type:complete